MGESPVLHPVADSKMGDSGAALEVSVSFGRFENDLLSWERWSAFPTNKYLEEVEKFSTPGSVAQKKAYFEAHYKRIAARKSEEDKKEDDEDGDEANSEESVVEQEMDQLKLDDRNTNTGIESENHHMIEMDDRNPDAGIKSEDHDHDHRTRCIPLVASEMVVDEACFEDGSEELERSEEVGVEKEDDTSVEVQRDLGSVDKEEEDQKGKSLESQKVTAGRTEEVVVVKEDDTPVELQRKVASADKEGKVQRGKPLKSQKATIGRKPKDATIPKKKPAPSATKSSLLSNSKVSRPALSRSVMSEPRAPSKKKNETAPLIGKKPIRSESRRASPPLHMSLSLDPRKSQPAPNTTARKSLIMDQMGEKDIVKRAFKAFRSSNADELPSSRPSKPTLSSQIQSKDSSLRSHVAVSQKKIEGVKKMVKKSPQSSQTVPRKTSSSTRLPNAAGAEKTKSISSSYNLRSQDKPDKRRENLKENAEVKAAVRPQLQPRAKKEAEAKRVQHNLNTKAKAVSMTTALKTSLDRKGGKERGL